MTTNRGALGATRELTHAECLEHLRLGGVGRLACASDGQPEIFPVDFVLDGDRVVIRTDAGTKLAHATLDRVAFEVDGRSLDDRGWWSVVVKGTAREITTALDDASVRERLLPLAPAGASPGDHWIRIVPREITGRLIIGRGE